MTEAQTNARRTPLDIIPSASNPQLLTHLLEMIARGVRSSRGLEEALGVDPRTLRYYLQAARWLGLLAPVPDPVLSSDGLAYVYAGAARHEVYARAVRAQPFLAELLDRCEGHTPDPGTIAHAIRHSDPSLAQTTVERRASAIRSLLEPALDPAPLPDDDGQLALPLAQVPRVAPEPPLTSGAGRAFSPDLYRYVLCSLLDHGELTLGHLRAMLDQAGADDVPLGAYVELALARGDAQRVGDRLVVTRGAIARRDLAGSTTSVILSDGGWRDALESLRQHPQDAGSGRRYRLWFRRLMGREASREEVDAALADVLQDRSLASFPVARKAPDPEPVVVEQSFVDTWRASGLVISLPAPLVQLWEGVSGINRRLRTARTRADAVGLPSIAYRPVACHGGLMHPGETLPRAIADARALRLRAVSRSPYLALTVALLMLPRILDRAPNLRRHEGHWTVSRSRHRYGRLLEVLDAFAAFRGWHPSRLPHAGLDDDVLCGLLERLSVARDAGDRLLLDDAFFLDLRSAEGARGIGQALEEIAGALASWLDRLDEEGRQH